MTASELKYQVETKGSSPYFFTRKTMSFFGDTMRNFGVQKTVIFGRNNERIDVYEIYRKRPVKHGLQNSRFFDRETFQEVWEAKP